MEMTAVAMMVGGRTAITDKMRPPRSTRMLLKDLKTKKNRTLVDEVYIGAREETIGFFEPRKFDPYEYKHGYSPSSHLYKLYERTYVVRSDIAEKARSELLIRIKGHVSESEGRHIMHALTKYGKKRHKYETSVKKIKIEDAI